MEKVIGLGLVFVAIVALIVGLALLFAFPTMWVANYLFAPTFLTAVFGVVKLSFWKAFWLNFLSASLFKSTSGGK